MIYLAIFLIILSLFLIYKEKGDSRIFLFLLIIGWIVSIFCFALYLQYLEQRQLYINLFIRVLYEIDLIPKVNISSINTINLVITVMNFGVLLFIYSSLCFSLSFVKPIRNNKLIYIFLTIIPLIEFIYYCPWIYEFIYRLIFNHKYINISFNVFYNVNDYIHYFSIIFNYLYIIIGLIFLIYQYLRTPRFKYFQNYFLLMFSCYFSIILLFTILFWWAPKRLISLTTSKNTTHILPVSILIEGRMLNYYPYVTIIIFLIMLYSLYKFNHLYINLKNIQNIILKSFDISSSGIRFYNHILKNYAMAILIDAEKLMNKINEKSDISIYINRIIRESKDLLNVLNKIQSKLALVTLQLKIYNVKEIMDDALESVNLDKIILNYNSEEKLYALLDYDHIKETFINILNNAIQAMSGNKKILTITIGRHKSWIYISISDTGIGINKQELHKIFLPFYSTKNTKENWGLGLTYCYRIIMAHHGKIYVESEEGKGTTIKILLPFIE